MSRYRKTKDRSYENFIDEDFKRVAEKHGIDEQELRDNFYDYFGHVKGLLEDPRMPHVFITYLGTFKTTIGRFNWIIKDIIRRSRLGFMTKKTALLRIAKIWPIRHRLKQELKRTKNTWKDWRDEGEDAISYFKKLSKYAKAEAQGEQQESIPQDRRQADAPGGRPGNTKQDLPDSKL